MKLPEKLLKPIQGLKALNIDREHARLDPFVDHRQLVEAVDAVRKATEEDEQVKALAKFSSVMAQFGTIKHRGVKEVVDHLYPMRWCLKALADEANTFSRGAELSEPIRRQLAQIAVYAGGAYRYLTRRGEALEAAYRMRL